MPVRGRSGPTAIDLPDFLTRAAIWLSLVSWTAAEALRLSGGDARAGAARVFWMAGALLALVHVALAFHLHHAWSHASALSETARQTRELLGLSVGAGVYVNYLFLAVWAADALWWWASPLRYAARPRWLDLGVRGFLLFIFVNGAIVFGRGPVRIAGVASLLVLLLAWWRGSEPALERA
jgi:hypothetical protein